jgi:hypothetical protein
MADLQLRILRLSQESGCNIDTYSHFRGLTVTTLFVAAPVPMIMAGVLTLLLTSLR